MEFSLLFGMDKALFLLFFLGLISYFSWIFFTSTANKIGPKIASGAMFLIVLLLLWRVFQLNLELVLQNKHQVNLSYQVEIIKEG